jgi:hypothetical protein
MRHLLTRPFTAAVLAAAIALTGCAAPTGNLEAAPAPDPVTQAARIGAETGARVHTLVAAPTGQTSSSALETALAARQGARASRDTARRAATAAAQLVTDQEKERQRIAEEERARKEAARKKAQEVARRKAEQEAARKAAEEAARQAEQEAAAQEAQRNAEQEAAAHQTRQQKSPLPAPATQPAGSPKAIAQSMLPGYGWGGGQWGCLEALWERESNWNPSAQNPSSGAYGIPQALPGSKMASVGADWQTNPATQIRWGLGYISARYGTPCNAWAHSQSSGWY